jgi:hypothetical protein
MDPLPQINRVFSMIMQQERKVQYSMISAPAVSLDETPTGLVNVVDGQRQFRRGRGNNTFQVRGRGNGKDCSFYEKSGHTIETCYKKHGYPTSFGRGGGNSYANMVECEKY